MSSGNHLYLDPLLVQVCLYELREPFISGPLTRSGVSMSSGIHLYLGPLLVQVCLYEFWEPFISGPLTRSAVCLSCVWSGRSVGKEVWTAWRWGRCKVALKASRLPCLVKGECACDYRSDRPGRPPGRVDQE